MIKLNGEIIKPTIFPDKTSQVWQLEEGQIGLTAVDGARILWDFEDEGEIISVLSLIKLMMRYLNPKDIRLDIPYLPYGRQDKEVTNDSTFNLRVLADILNTLHEDIVITTLDAHSKVAKGLINNLKFDSIHLISLMETINEVSNDTVFCYPDKGAVERYTEQMDHPYIYGNKVRDQKTGWITHYELVGDVKGEKVLIIDDICDGGITFKILAKNLLEAGATEVNLYVTHGIFSKGIDTLRESGINRIFTHKGEVK